MPLLSLLEDLPATPVGGELTEGLTDAEIAAKFKDTQGRYRTQSLFIETPHPEFPAFFTLKKLDKTKNGIRYTSMYRLYMEIADPTEYQVALRLLGSWNHWEALQKAEWFRTHLQQWRAELKVRMESDRYFEMLDHGKAKGAQGIQATKWLAERYGSGETPKRGRPSDQEVTNERKRLAAVEDDLAADATRIGIV